MLATTSRTVPFSARITAEDIEFIAELDIEGAQTPSDKLRAILADARRRRDASTDFNARLQLAQESLAPVRLTLINAEREQRLHSEIAVRTLDGLPELLAFLGATIDNAEPLSAQQLKEIERGITERIVRMTNAIIQTAMTGSECYDRTGVLNRIQALVELTDLLTLKLNKEKETSS